MTPEYPNNIIDFLDELPEIDWDYPEPKLSLYLLVKDSPDRIDYTMRWTITCDEVEAIQKQFPEDSHMIVVKFGVHE